MEEQQNKPRKNIDHHVKKFVMFNNVIAVFTLLMAVTLVFLYFKG
ncbi:MAG: hypothetical protein Q8P90_01465 [bacterium]|nr:hypothetical protein [bacterium]